MESNSGKKRSQILSKSASFFLKYNDELTRIVCEENGKAWDEAVGDVGKAIEGTELAIQAPSLMMGESIMDASSGFDTVKYREPMGVFAGIVPVNFPCNDSVWLDGSCLRCMRQHYGA